MKKNKNKEYYKKLSKKRGQHNLERKSHLYNPSSYSEHSYSHLQSQYTPPKPKTIDAPLNFSIVNNPDESMSFLNQSMYQIEELGKDILQDFRYIISVTPDALLYMMAYIESLKVRNISYSITGSYPRQKECNRLFKESGFLEHLKDQKEELENMTTDILTIKVGSDTESLIAQKVVKYVRKWLNLEKKDTRSIYKILIECMANTHNHAYSKSKNNHKWYLMAYHHQNEVHFVFLDNGYGIPHTIRKNWGEILFGEDNKLITSALEGKIKRSQTGQRKRGKGLPLIFKQAQDPNIKELIIIANKGYVNCKDGTTKTLENKFKGTLLSWKFKKGETNE